ncbi:MFS transporter [Streptomyces sp. NPDC026672]|uniref:MFS transporter n=1 Tax=unclassified Streptomyces TaxID=2593676 RepID=UPI0033FB6D58
MHKHSAAPRSTAATASFLVVLVAVSAWSMLTSLVVPVLPVIQHDLHTSQNTITWVLTAYLLAASVATPIVGRIGDSHGKKKTLIVVLTLFAVGVVLAAVATSAWVMIAARAIQGVGGAILPLGFGILRERLPAERVGSAVSATAAMVAVGGGLGIVLAGPIASALSYHFLFWLPLVLVLAAILAAALVVPESPAPDRTRLNAAPAVTLAGWLVTLLLAVSEGGSWGWTAPATLILLAATVVLCALWIRSELRSANPLVDMQMMRIPAVWTTNLVALLFGMCMYATLGLLPQFVQTPASAGYGFGATATAAGLYMLPMTAVMFAAGLLAAPMTIRFGPRAVLFAGAVLTTAPLAVLAWAHDNPWEIYLASGVLGAGIGLAYAAASQIVVTAVPAHQTGIASGMNANIRTIGGSIGNAVTAGVVTAHLRTDGLPTQTGYTTGFAVLVVVGIAAAAASLLIPRGSAATPQPDQPSAPGTHTTPLPTNATR